MVGAWRYGGSRLLHRWIMVKILNILGKLVCGWAPQQATPLFDFFFPFFLDFWEGFILRCGGVHGDVVGAGFSIVG